MPEPDLATAKGPPALNADTDSRARPWLALAILSVAAAVAYANSFETPFVFDGILFIREDSSVRDIFAPSSWTRGIRPVGFLSFALNYACGGYEVWGYHAVNLAIHVAAAWLLFDIVRTTLSRGRLKVRYAVHAWGLGLAVALIWLVHPLQTQSVTYIYQRLESLMGLFYLATLWCFLRALSSPHRAGWYAASVACCALGMGTKEVMITAPWIVLWYDRAFTAESWRQIFAQRGRYYGALAATWCLLAAIMLSQAKIYPKLGVFVVKGVSPLAYALSQPGVILHYLQLSFWPNPLCLDYGWPVATQAIEIVPPSLAIGALVALTAWAAYRRPERGFLGGWFFLILAPTSSVAPIIDLAFEHRMYLPLAAVVTLLVMVTYHALQYLLTRFAGDQADRSIFARLVPAALLLAVVAVLASRTALRNEDYRSNLSIWQDTLHKRPQNRRAEVNVRIAIEELELARTMQLHRAGTPLVGDQ